MALKINRGSSNQPIIWNSFAPGQGTGSLSVSYVFSYMNFFKSSSATNRKHLSVSPSGHLLMMCDDNSDLF